MGPTRRRGRAVAGWLRAGRHEPGSTRAAPGLIEPLLPWSHATTSDLGDAGGRATSQPERQVVVLTYHGVSSTEVELVADALAKALGARVRLVAADVGPVVGVEPARQIETEPLSAVTEATALVIPGGLGWKREAERGEVVRWLDRLSAGADGVLAVSTGSLLLASIGLLADRDATGHWLAGDLLADLGARPSMDRIVRGRRLVTATGARSGIEAATELADQIRFGPR